MDLHFRSPELHDVERARGEALSVGIYSDERPPHGVAGLLDWRLCGRLSRLLKRGVFLGELGEGVLLPSAGRLSFEKVFLHGLGERAQFDLERSAQVVDRMLRTLARAGARSSAIVLPGRLRLSRRDAMTQLLRLSDGYPELDELTLVESGDAQRVLVSVVEGERRRARALAMRDD
ncbi:MAG: hypothetical protein GXP55_07660 [Deltaproteobacteria bacterium]|nr:hypothetical protein [Deltaproteobacteria bacterium]